MNNCSAISSREQVTVYSCYTHVKTEPENSCCLAENEQLCSYIKSRTNYCIFMLHSPQDWARKATTIFWLSLDVSVAWIYGNLFSTWYSWTIVHFPLSNNYFRAQSWRSCYIHLKTERENSCCLGEKEQLFSYIKSRTSYCIFLLHSRQDWSVLTWV
jgi:hypothetical protein